MKVVTLLPMGCYFQRQVVGVFSSSLGQPLTVLAVPERRAGSRSPVRQDQVSQAALSALRQFYRWVLECCFQVRDPICWDPCVPTHLTR